MDLYFLQCNFSFLNVEWIVFAYTCMLKRYEVQSNVVFIWKPKIFSFTIMLQFA